MLEKRFVSNKTAACRSVHMLMYSKSFGLKDEVQNFVNELETLFIFKRNVF